MAETAPAPPEAGEDAAWVGVDTSLSSSELIGLLDDPERLFRVNSLWKFDAWEWLSGDRFHLSIHNQSIDRQWETNGTVIRKHDGFRLEYEEGIKTYTDVRVEETESGSRLWIVDDYSRLPEAERRGRKDEVDRSLTRWGEDIHRYLSAWARWSGHSLWRWYMERVWRRATPLGRRIIRLLIWLTLIEFVVFLMLITVLALEMY